MATVSPITQQIGSRLRKLRLARNLSVRTLATHAGFSASFISQVERGQASLSIDSLGRVADALGITLSDIFVPAPDQEPVVVRANGRQLLSSSWSSSRSEALGSVDAHRLFITKMVTIDPGGCSGAALHGHHQDEFVIVFNGQVLLGWRGTEQTLHRGDSVTIPAGLEHGWRNTSEEPAQLVMVTTRAHAHAITIGSEQIDPTA